MVGPTSPNGSYSRGRVCATTKRKLKIPPLFQAGWFVESVLTQTLIIHIIRTTKIPFIESRASAALITTTIITMTMTMMYMR